MRILHIIPTLNRGGAERLLVDLARHHDKNNFSISVIVFKGLGDFESELRAAGVEIISVLKHHRYDLVGVTLRLRDMIQKLNPDIVHTHLGGDIYGRMAARLAGIVAIVSTEHNINRDEFWPVTLLKRWTAGFACRVIAVSKAVAADAIKRYGLAANRCTVIYNGVDIEIFKPQPPRNDEGFIVGAVGRLMPQKNFESLIKAVSLCGDPAIRCRIAGEGPLREKLTNLILSLGLESRISLVGSQADMPAFYKNIDILVVPSLWEGFGLAAVEAGATQRPVIAADVDGLKEIIIDRENGLLCNPVSAQEIAEKITALKEDRDMASALAKRLQEAVIDNFTIERMVRNYEALYTELATNKV